MIYKEICRGWVGAKHVSFFYSKCKKRLEKQIIFLQHAKAITADRFAIKVPRTFWHIWSRDISCSKCKWLIFCYLLENETFFCPKIYFLSIYPVYLGGILTQFFSLIRNFFYLLVIYKMYKISV